VLHIAKTLTAFSAAALLVLGLVGPASAIQRTYQVGGGTLNVAGGSINCASGCTVTVLDDGTTQIDTADGQSYWSDGSGLYGAP
jgi:hypothetical protein